VEIYTIGFTKKSAEQFFGLLRDAGILRVIDIRLNNSSQLAGFTKARDLEFFLREICDAEYVHLPLLAPEESTLKAYRDSGDWETYVAEFNRTLEKRAPELRLDPESFVLPTALLCSEPTSKQCHRRLVVEYLAAKWPDVVQVDL
jgi:uncharacterized protein (DUF488 family)